jgi:signal transduction histidine kinase
MAERIDVLTATRSGAVDAQAAELRRIERDLHDGAQARLVALAMDLGMAREKLGADPGAAEALVAEAHEGAKRALAELRDLARGIHPAVLTDRGLEAALASLAGTGAPDVDLETSIPERPPPAIEAAAYFVVAEALANAAKHSGAARVRVRVARAGDRLLIEVADDGRGGADPAGEGLVGLRRRVEALDGRLEVADGPDGGTVVRAELPCGS